MPKVSFIIPILIIVIVIIFLYRLLSSKPQSRLPMVDVNIKDVTYSLEIAKSLTQHSKGLSGRTSLCPSCGMIFVFDNESTYPFWMKDTLIPLDLIWLDHTGRIVTIHTAQPEPGVSTFSLKRYSNNSPASYVVELNAGDISKLSLKVGDTINIPKL